VSGVLQSWAHHEAFVMTLRTPPFLPFAAGPAEFRVGLRPIPLDRWLTPDWESAALEQKRALLDTRLGEVFRALPSAAAVQEEAAAAVAAAVAAPLPGPASAPPLTRAARLVSDDLVVLEPADGAWRAVAAVLCSPTFFSAADAVGADVFGLHNPVPDRLGPEGAQALGARIARVFDHLGEAQVLERFNWTVQAGAERFTPDGAPLRARALSARDEEGLDLMHLRVERQTIRRLSASGATLFTIRISLDPLRAVFAEAGAREAFAAAWAATPDHVRGYKKWAPYERLVGAALRAG